LFPRPGIGTLFIREVSYGRDGQDFLFEEEQFVVIDFSASR
jgi:hypothetical protein